MPHSAAQFVSPYTDKTINNLVCPLFYLTKNKQYKSSKRCQGARRQSTAAIEGCIATLDAWVQVVIGATSVWRGRWMTQYPALQLVLLEKTFLSGSMIFFR